MKPSATVFCKKKSLNNFTTRQINCLSLHPIFKQLKVKNGQDFLIPVFGLKLGESNFQFVVDQSFFEGVDDLDFSDPKVNVNLDVDKQENMITFDFDIKGSVKVACDRCADEYNQSIEGKYTLFVKYGLEYKEESEDVIIIPADQHQFDVTQFIYEYIVLLLPLRKVHPNDENGNSMCNKEVIERLNRHEVSENIDPRWEALKNLKTE